jgi:hypothetical protein
MIPKLLAGCALACAAIALTGCAAMGGSSSDLLKQLDSNFATCDRHITFQGGVGVVTPGAQMSGSIDCKGAAPDSGGASAAPRATP